MSSDTNTPTGTASYRRRTEASSFIETSGGLLTEQLVRKLRERECEEDAVDPTTFALPEEEPPTAGELEDEIGEAWEDLRERWDELTQDNALFSMDVSDARERWILKLLETLDFNPEYIQGHLDADGVKADLSHYGWPYPENVSSFWSMGGRTPPVIHTLQPGSGGAESPSIELDDGNHPGATGRQKSPHDELQTYLNASDDQQWGIVTDGLKLRVLRDYYHTYTRGYVEFDLENIFTNRNYGDFRALYRLCHASRFIEPVYSDDEDVEIPLEQLYQIAVSTGVKVGQDLQENVVSALETLGNGFLSAEIEKALTEGGQDAAEDYYQDLLYVVYRLLFMLFTEQRGMMSTRGSDYTDEYSVTKLRERAEQRDDGDRNTDLWEGLKATFRLVGEGENSLGVPGYNGALFDNDNLEFILDAECPNEKLLSAVHDLTHIEQEGYQQRISYADLGVEEIGAVYESLLEFTPQLAETVIKLEDRTISSGTFYLDDRGMERKETGSFYTDPGLVDELIQSALKPVVEEKVDENASTEVQEQQLLDIAVCDPACGSGAFLIAANNFLGQRLAEIRSDSLYPDEKTVRQSRRSVVQHCIYGVDLNPMAVELAKVSLWINSAVEDKPLSFLDHRIKQGNSLIGTTPELLSQGVPVDAYETSSGRDWHKGNEIRKRVRQENSEIDDSDRQVRLDRRWGQADDDYVSLAEQLDQLDEGDIEDVHEKEQIYQQLRESESFQREKLAHDVWTAAFYWPLDGSADEYPTPNTIERIRRDPPKPADKPLDELKGLQQLRERAERISEQQSFFHWQIEYPEVYRGSGGFDTILGNPPWETLEMKEKEFFHVAAPEIAGADTQAKRKRMIQELEEKRPELYERYQDKQDQIQYQAKFISDSERYPLAGQGKINLYPAFAEHALENTGGGGRAGIIVPTGIATDYNTRDFFAELVDERKLVSLFDFVNKELLFQGIPADQRFCLLTLQGGRNDDGEFEFSFLNRNLDMLNDSSRRYTLTKDQIAQINPNTFNCPIFERKRDRDITLQLYEAHPVLRNLKQESNPWDIQYHTMYNISSDSDLFDQNTLENLRGDGCDLGEDGIFRCGDKTYLPLWEAKFYQQYDHRFGSFEGIPEEKRFTRRAGTKRLTPDEKKDPNKEIIPRYWLDQNTFEDKRETLDWYQDWIFSFREIARVTSDARTTIGTIIPMYPCVHKAPVITFDVEEPAEKGVLFTTIFTSFTFDFALRQSLGGTSVSRYIIRQLPMPTPETIDAYNVLRDGNEANLREYLLERGLELLWTSHSLDSLGEDLNNEDGPYIWDSEKRRGLRAEIEAAVAHVFGLDRSDFEYILDSFETLKDQERKEYGEYLRKTESLQAFDEMEVKE